MFPCIIPTPTPRRWKAVLAHHWPLLHSVLHNPQKTYPLNCYTSTNFKGTLNCFLHSFSRNKNCYFPPPLFTASDYTYYVIYLVMCTQLCLFIIAMFIYIYSIHHYLCFPICFLLNTFVQKC